MALIGILVAFGTFLIVFGTVFATSASAASRDSIIRNFTGDFILYSDKSKDLPSPFSFNSPLPRIRDVGAVEAALESMAEVEAYAPYAQNYGVVQVERDGKKTDLPFIFYAVEPDKYLKVFGSVKAEEGSFFGYGAEGGGSPKGGIMVSNFQNEAYRKSFGLTLKAGEGVTLLGVTEGGVNTTSSTVVGVFEPAHFKSVFNYINFMDAGSYAKLYDYSGVESLPAAFDKGLAAADSATAGDESAIFGLAADPALGSLDLSKLKAQPLSGATMIAVRLKDHGSAEAAISRIALQPGLGVKAARWDAASGFYAQIAAGLQAFIYLATALIFLVVTLIFMNTLIINVTERTAEIGTMRALGAGKTFIRGLFVAEALVLNLGASLVGMAGAGAALLAFGKKGVPLPEIVSQFLIGGGSVRLHAGLLPFVLGLAVVALVSVLATIYPVGVATSITPLKAMSDK